MPPKPHVPNIRLYLGGCPCAGCLRAWQAYLRGEDPPIPVDPERWRRWLQPGHVPPVDTVEHVKILGDS